MKKWTGLMISVWLGFVLAVSGVDEAYAKRLGGGRSFGGRPSYTMPYQRSAPDANRAGMPQPNAPAYSAATQKNQALRNSLAQRGGLTRMLGGLALGGLLGALLFGGAFEQINFLDILIFGAIAFMLYKLLAARRRAQPAGTGGYYPDASDAPYQRRGDAGQADFDTDALFGKNRSAAAGGSAPHGGYGPATLPADFDPKVFLDGARAAYEMMQQAWDRGDLAELRTLTTDKVFAELQDQIRARGGASNRTELLKVEAELLEVRDVGPDREATVLFVALLREEPGESPTEVREVWHFIRPRNSRQPTWFLDGIRQVED